MNPTPDIPISIAQTVAAWVRSHSPDAAASLHADGPHPWVTVQATALLPVMHALRDQPAFRFNLLRCLTGLDYPTHQQLAVAYDLGSFDLGHELCVKVFVPRERPEVPSVAGIWKAADWHEREAFDLLGINFLNHPDTVTDDSGTHPRRILLPEDWTGHPLRKDYQFPREYQGIPGSVEIDWAQKANYPA